MRISGRGAFGAVVLGVATTAIWACSGDDAASDAPRDGGADTGLQPYVPPDPLACSNIGTFDPCVDAATLPVNMTMHVLDAGPDAALEAGAAIATNDGTCVASNAVRIACDGGGAQYDLTAGDAGSSIALAWSPASESRFTINDDGTTSSPAAIPHGYASHRIVNGPLGVATVHASSKSVYFRRDNVPTDAQNGFVTTKADLDDANALRAIHIDRGGNLGVLATPSHPPAADYFQLAAQGNADTTSFIETDWLDFAFDSTNAVWGAGPGPSFGGGASSNVTVDEKSVPFRFAFGANDRPLIASYQRGVLSFHTTLADDPHTWVRFDLDQTGECDRGDPCASVCKDSHRLLAAQNSPSGDFVTTESGRSFFVYADAFVAREVQCRTDVGVLCGLFDTCNCSCTTDVQSAADPAIVVLELDLAGYRVTERTRVRLPFQAPKSMFALRNSDGTAVGPPPAVEITGGRQIFASARGNVVHAGVQDGSGELARVVLDLSR